MTGYADHDSFQDRRVSQHNIPPHDADIYQCLGELINGGRERKEQVAELFTIMRDHTTKEQAWTEAMAVSLAGLTKVLEHLSIQIETYSEKCESTDKALDKRLKDLEADRSKVHGMAKLFGLGGLVATGITIWQFLKG